MQFSSFDTVELILTHQNADFDAVASMLGAHKLNPQAIPVLPSRLHAGVREFLALYRNGLPFVDWDDFKPQTIERIIITDTASRLEIKGVPVAIPTIIIEHHPLERELKAHESWAGDLVGAATSLLVEGIREQGIAINSLEATLMALGIYADTGNFTYAGTTIRDMQAAAWLLEQGADLDMIRRFLASPLNAEQQALLEKLMGTAEIRRVMGFNVMVCTAETDKHIDSVNSVVAVLRDIFDSDALFAVIAMPNVCQLICRSTDDAIDVGELAKEFGGGGHPRASAAAIYKQEKETIVEAIWDYLHKHIEADTRVADLMSFGVQTVEADEKILDIIQRIRRIGHEGFPVLDKDEVVGLLNLRDADKTLEHGLTRATVREVMLGGRVRLRPEDPVSRLEAVMVESEWGQIPVVDEANKLIGIVTRTDLIKHWGRSHPAVMPEAPRLSAEKVEAILGKANEALIEIIAAFAHARDIPLYMVGGVVRDLLLERPNFDIDFVVEEDAIGFAEALKNTYGGRIHPYPPFGTATWSLDEAVAERLGLPLAEIPQHLDFATSRSELYEHPTALPTVYNSGIKLDLRRRDFTINTLAVQLSPRRAMWRILDFYGGIADLEDRLIRVLHSLSFVDDPTRILRAIRFGKRLQFTIEARTAELIASALPTLRRITGERLQNELSLLLKEKTGASGILKLEAMGVLGAIHPAFHAHPNLAKLFMRLEQGYPQWDVDEHFLRWHLLMADIPSETVPEIAQRLLISQQKAEAMQQTANLAQNPAMLLDLNAKVSELVDLLTPLSKESLLSLWLYWDKVLIRERLEHYVETWQHIKPFTDGNALKARGLKPSPAFGQILQRLRQAWLDGEIANQAAEERLLEALIKELA
jgi:tRNA nucleotidyltransferase (CCA-adding enzyme)